MDAAAVLRIQVVQSLREQGFKVSDGAMLPPRRLSKDRIRRLHQTAVEHRRDQAKASLSRREPELLRHFASGAEVDPMRISPRLVEVHRGSEEELLFRYASLHWSIPVSSGYGRRLRFVVVDDQNSKLIGLIGLGDPVYSLRSRDEWIGWDAQQRKERLGNVMDAFVLGAVPPYSFLLFGKLVAMFAASDTVRSAFKRKYGGTRSLIGQRLHDGRLAMITTTSALGRSSIYNRLRMGGRLVYESVGYTKGSGEFHFSNSLYRSMSQFALQHCAPTAKHGTWGTGFRNRREVVKKCLPAIGLSSRWVYHGVEREVFVVPLARNTREFLRGESSRLTWYWRSETDTFKFFRERWMLPRLATSDLFASWTTKDWAIWNKRRDRA